MLGETCTVLAWIVLLWAVMPLIGRAAVEGPYTYEIVDGGVVITDFDQAYAGALSIPNTLGGVPVTSIGSGAFAWNEDLTEVTIPDSVIDIQRSAFSWCAGLVRVTLGGSVTTIGDLAFHYCRNLAEIAVDPANRQFSSHQGVLYDLDQMRLICCPGGKSGAYAPPETVQRIEEVAFAGGAVSDIRFPAGLREVGLYAFRGCDNLTYCVIPSEVTELPEQVLADCRGLTNVVVGGSVTNIGAAAFDNCLALRSVTLPSGLIQIGEKAFSSCAALDGVILPEGLTDIGDSAFSGCGSLAAIEIPDSVVRLGVSAFSSCTYLEQVSLGGGVSALEDGTFNGCRWLSRIDIPANVTRIGRQVFMSCDRLAIVNLAEGLAEIGDRAFWYCPVLTRIDLPDTLTHIGERAFESCLRLGVVTFGSGIVSFGKHPFLGSYRLSRVYFRGDAPPISDAHDIGLDRISVYYLPGTAGWETALDGAYKRSWDSAPDSIRYDRGTLQMTIRGQWGDHVEIQVCDDMAFGVWRRAHAMAYPEEGAVSYHDEEAGTNRKRFYRVMGR